MKTKKTKKQVNINSSFAKLQRKVLYTPHSPFFCDSEIVHVAAISKNISVHICGKAWEWWFNIADNPSSSLVPGQNDVICAMTHLGHWTGFH